MYVDAADGTTIIDGLQWLPAVTDLGNGVWRIAIGSSFTFADGIYYWHISIYDALSNSTVSSTYTLTVDAD